MRLGADELARRTGLTVRTLHHYDGLVLFCATGALFEARPHAAEGLPEALRLGVALAYNATA